jgi:fructokinase
VKLSEDDCYRLFAELKSEDYIFEYFHNLGASTICLTKGKKGVVISDINKGMFFQEAQPIEKIIDATGAGDAFWTGFLYAHLNGMDLEESITVAQKLASLKLQNVGRLPDDVNFKEYLNQ